MPPIIIRNYGSTRRASGKAKRNRELKSIDAQMAPISLVGFGLDLATVVATDLLFATLTKLPVTSVHHKNQFTDWQVTKRLWLGSIPATIAIIWLAQSGNLFASQVFEKLRAIQITSGHVLGYIARTIQIKEY